MEDCVGACGDCRKGKPSGLQKTKRFAAVVNLLSRDEAVGALGAGIATWRGPPVILADALCLVALKEGKSSMSVGYQAKDRKRSSLPNGPRDPSSKTECLSAYARNWETKVSREAYMTIKGKKQGDISRDAFKPDSNGQVAKGGSVSEERIAFTSDIVVPRDMTSGVATARATTSRCSSPSSSIGARRYCQRVARTGGLRVGRIVQRTT
ncbi:hypothetical protein ACVWWO_003476 [Bradyrhizobium sp. F1.13.1]